jgi:hypothetical protein
MAPKEDKGYGAGGAPDQLKEEEVAEFKEVSKEGVRS